VRSGQCLLCQMGGMPSAGGWLVLWVGTVAGWRPERGGGGCVVALSLAGGACVAGTRVSGGSWTMVSRGRGMGEAGGGRQDGQLYRPGECARGGLCRVAWAGV